VNFAWPECSMSLKADPELTGKTVKCPGCSTKFQIPETLTPPAPDSGDGAEGGRSRQPDDRPVRHRCLSNSGLLLDLEGVPLARPDSGIHRNRPRTFRIHRRIRRDRRLRYRSTHRNHRKRHQRSRNCIQHHLARPRPIRLHGIPYRRRAKDIVKYTETSTRLRNEVSLREGAGEGPDDIKDPASTFQRALRKIASEENSYVWFYVKGDSFDMYLDARNLADEMKALTGWEPWGADFFVQTIIPIEVVALKTTPPKKSGAAGKTVKGVGKTLD